jgi:hypothetical protein
LRFRVNNKQDAFAVNKADLICGHVHFSSGALRDRV